MRKFLLSIAVVAAVLLGAWIVGSLHRSGNAGGKGSGEGMGSPVTSLPSGSGANAHHR